MNPKTFNTVRSWNAQAQSLFNDLKAMYSGVVTVSGSVGNLNTLIAANKATGNPNPVGMYVFVDSDNPTDKVVRYTIDGTTPDPVNFFGIAKRDSDEFIITEFHNIQLFRFIEESSNSTTLYVTFLRSF